MEFTKYIPLLLCAIWQLWPTATMAQAALFVICVYFSHMNGAESDLRMRFQVFALAVFYLRKSKPMNESIYITQSINICLWVVRIWDEINTNYAICINQLHFFLTRYNIIFGLYWKLFRISDSIY